MRSAFLGLVVSACLLPAWSQQPQQEKPQSQPPPQQQQQPQPQPQPPVRSDQIPTYRKTVNLVNVFFNVKDKHGALVPNLKKEQFELLEDGKPQTIKYFSAESNLPLTLGILIDSSGSQVGVPAIRAPGSKQSITLAAGGTASALLQIPDPGIYSAAQCAPANAAELKVYPPNQTGAAHQLSWCGR